MHDRLPLKICVQGHVTSKFWEISDNISKTVQERHSCNGRLIGNHMCPVEWHHYR